MEDYIYLIFLVAWIAFSLYRRSQKKSAAAAGKPPSGPHREREIKPLPTIEEILFGKEEAPAPATSPDPPSWMEEGNYSPEPVETSFEKEYKAKGIQSVESAGKPKYMNQIKLTDLQKDEISDENDKIDLSDEIFNLRKAVIYSEILNRPYI